MSGGEFLEVDPRTLRLPASRRHGADPAKLPQQISRYGTPVVGMPALLVSRGSDRIFSINDGVTRATRVAMLLPGVTVRVEVIEESP